MVEPSENNFEQQAEELESLGYIFPEEMTILQEKPYKLEISLNSNTESEERNFLKLKAYFDLGTMYPDVEPYFRLKNLSPDYMDNNFLDRCETKMREHAQESLGQMMIFELCDMVKSEMCDINERVLAAFDKVEEAKKIDTSLATTETTRHLNFTPVNAETFKVWCDAYMENLRIQREAFKSDKDEKLTGRQLFELNKSAFEDLTINYADDGKQSQAEESKDESKDENEDED